MQNEHLFEHGRALSPFVPLLGWVVGTALQLQQAALAPVWVYGGMAAAGLLGLAWLGRRTALAPARWRDSLWLRVATCLLAAAALAFAVTGLRSLVFASGALDPALEGQDLRVVGVVTDMPQRNEAGLRFTLAVESARKAGRAVAVPALVDVGWYSGGYGTGGELPGAQNPPAEVRAGERWECTLRLKAPHGSHNPYGFDLELWLWERGVQATAYVRAGARDGAPQRVAQTWHHPVALLRQSVRERIFAHVESRTVAGLIAALVVGDQAAIERADWDVFRATGVAHLVSISGLHITMFAWGSAWAIAWLWRRSVRLCLLLPASSAALLGGVLLACAYAVFSGWGLPAQRTCVMLATVALLRHSGLQWPWPQTWMLACALVVACDPWALLQAGFWLSFVAVGVLFATDGGPVDAQPEQAGLHRAIRHLRAMLHEQWVVTVALAPLTLLLFGQISLVGVLANAFAIPWVTLVVTPLAMLGVALPALWGLAGAAIALFLHILQSLAAWPWATVALATAPWWMAAAGVLGGVLLVARLPGFVRVLGLPLLLPVLLWQAPLPPSGQFELLAADVGQGNALLVRTASHALLYDAGPRYSQDSDAGHRVLLPLLQALQTRLDLVLLSHRDTDHVGGAPAVLAMQPQAALLSSIASDDPLQSQRRVQRCEAGQHWDWDGVQFDILHPAAADYARPHTPNATSCVLRIQSAASSAGGQPRVALLVGDIEAPQEAQLLAGKAALRADLLLVPHHGSKTSSSAAFLDAVQPQEAWVQAGYRNRYGHPAQEVVQRYHLRNILVRDSPHCGAMTWRSDAASQGICSRTASMRYWNHRVP